MILCVFCNPPPPSLYGLFKSTGILTDDTAVFQLAEEMAQRHGWNTKLVTQSFLCENAVEIGEAMAKFAGIKHGEHGNVIKIVLSFVFLACVCICHTMSLFN
jgi:hypothetical protein